MAASPSSPSIRARAQPHNFPVSTAASRRTARVARARPHRLTGAYEPAVSPDGQFVYIASYGFSSKGALSVFKREAGPTCSTAIASTAYGKTVTLPLRCVDADGDPVTVSIASVRITASWGRSTHRSRASPTPREGFHGTDNFTFRATTKSERSDHRHDHRQALPPPALTKVSESHKKWHRGKTTAFSFVLSEVAKVTFTFTRGGSSVGKMAKSGHAGKNKVTFREHLGVGAETRDLHRGHCRQQQVGQVKDPALGLQRSSRRSRGSALPLVLDQPVEMPAPDLVGRAEE